MVLVYMLTLGVGILMVNVTIYIYSIQYMGPMGNDD